MCVCVVREVNAVLLAHSRGSSWSKGRGAVCLNAGANVSLRACWDHDYRDAPLGPTNRTVCVCVCMCVNSFRALPKENKLTWADTAL